MSDDNLTNQALGDALGVTHAQASRYRSGDRVPTDLVMLKIFRLTDWPVSEQIEAKYLQLARLKKTPSADPSAGPYATELRERLPIALRRLQLEVREDEASDD